MTHDDAVKYLRMLLFGAQKARSNAMELYEGVDSSTVESLLSATLPWLFGPQSILPTMLRMIESVENGGKLEQNAFCNICMICCMLCPVISIAAGYYDPAARNLATMVQKNQLHHTVFASEW
jgi:succinate dehydrogenase/fumarate reductase-like Fe-S protein